MTTLKSRMIQVPAILMLIVLFYFLSYAPVLKIHSVYDEQLSFRTHLIAGMEFYEPVLWCIWKSPLQTPLLAWANLLGVKPQTEMNTFVYVQYQLHGEYIEF